MDETSLTLLEKIRSDTGGGDAWSRLIRLYEPFIGQQLARSGLGAEDVADLTQDVLTTLFRKIAQFERRRTGAFRTWLRTITHHTAVSWLRTDRGKPRAAGGDQFQTYLIALADPQSELCQSWDAEHNRFVVRRVLEIMEPEFSPHIWRMFRGYVVEGRPAADVAHECDSSVNAVKLAKSRVLRQIRKQVTELNGTSGSD